MADETIKVYFEPLGSIAGDTFNHETIVYTNSSGEQFIATSYASNSGPSGSSVANLSEAASAVTSGSSSVYGTLITQWGPASGMSQADLAHWLGSPDAPYQSQTVATGADLSQQWSTITGAYFQIGEQGLTYSPMTENSNSAASTALTAAGVDLPTGTDISGGYWSPAAGVTLPTSWTQASPDQTTQFDANSLGGLTMSVTDTTSSGAPDGSGAFNYDASGTLKSANLNYPDGSSEQQTYDPSSGVSTEYMDYSGLNETGTLVAQGEDFTSGGSQFEYFNPSSNITTETDNYTGTDGTGTLTSADVNFTGGTSEQDLYNPTSGVDVQFKDYSGLNETGTLEYQGDNWTAGGSQIEFFDPRSGVSTETDNYSGTYGSGTVSSADVNFTDGTSEQDLYNPSSNVAVEFLDYSGANETGTLKDEGFNWTAGGSQIDFFSPDKGVSEETDNYTGAYGGGKITSADLSLTDGFSLDYTFSYDSSGTETGFVVDEFNSSNQMVWTGEYGPTGGYLGGSGYAGYSGFGGYYGGGSGYGGGYDFVQKAPSSVGSGTNISRIAAHDAAPMTMSLSGAVHSDGHSAGAPGNSHWNPSQPFSVGSTPAANNGSGSTNIGIIAAYDRAVSADQAALAAEAARHQAMDSAANAGTSDGNTGAQFEGAKIAGDVITWSFATSPGTTAAPFSGYIDHSYKAAVEKAFQTWAAASGLTFKEVPDGAASDIRIGWGNFDTSTSGVIGYTSYRQRNGTIQPGTIIRLEDPAQDSLVRGSDGQLTYSGTQAELSQVALHEIGHALGLADDADPNSIMYYASGVSNRTLDQTDIAGIQTLYGSTPKDTGTDTSVRDPLTDLSASLSSALRFQQGERGGMADARLAKMIQAMSAVHESGHGWSEGSHIPLATAEPAITIATHPH
jgi:predicted Zn-dependent protease